MSYILYMKWAEMDKKNEVEADGYKDGLLSCCEDWKVGSAQGY